MRNHLKSCFPAFNVMRRNEAVATDTVYSDTRAIDNGYKCTQLFVGRETLVTDIHGMKTDKEFITSPEEAILKRGAMDKLISDRALSEINKKIHDILRVTLLKIVKANRITKIKTMRNAIMLSSDCVQMLSLIVLEHLLILGYGGCKYFSSLLNGKLHDKYSLVKQVTFSFCCISHFMTRYFILMQIRPSLLILQKRRVILLVLVTWSGTL
jgi:hypothetical protein